MLQARSKYVDLPLPELYDLGTDPHEQSNLVTTERSRAQVLLNLLRNELDLRCITPEGAFYTMVDVRRFGDEMRVAEAGLEQGVVTIPAAAFGDESKGYLRISFCADEERLSEGVRRLGLALASLT